jgi:hypothetical protein
MGWLPDSLWLNLLPLINGYNLFDRNNSSVYYWMFLVEYFI